MLAGTALVLLLLVGSPMAFLSLFFVMSSDTCAGATDAPICNADVQVLVASATPAGLLVGLLLSVIGMARARRARRWVAWSAAGWAVLAASFVAAATVATWGT